ncbi:MAG TPA: glycosyltransferase family 2 protein [Polyangia bacterium]|nr:glycosyltransferase family 2 protein [Polyangia bacterium]
MPKTVSLCMIVRNEAELLPRFIASAAGLWDQLCVVDTGSTDGTVAILEAAGATIIKRAWDDDFSAARNAGLDAATGDWILVLDADEMASPGLRTELRALIENDSIGAATLVMRNLLPHGHRREAPLLRLFRNDASIRFSFPIHEDVTGAVARYLEDSGRKLGRLTAVVEHLGYVRERAATRQKKERDTRLLMRCIEHDPGDFYSWFKLLELARFWRDRSLWTEAAGAAQKALDQAGPLALAERHYGGELIALVADGLYPGDAPRALSFIGAWIDLVPASAALFLRRGELRELVDETVGAAADFGRCRALADVTADVQLATVRPLMGLARLAIANADLPEAWRRVDEALAFNPRDQESLLLSMLIIRSRRGVAGARDFAAMLRSKYGDCPELHEALGEAALLACDAGTAVGELRLAAGEPPAGRTALRLAQALLAAGQVEASAELSAMLLPSFPEAGIGLLVSDLCRGRDSELELDIDRPLADQTLRAWIDTLRLGHRDILDSFASHAPALAPVFPWLAGYLSDLEPADPAKAATKGTPQPTFSPRA